MENNVQEDYKSEILDIVRSNASPGIMRDKLEDYHENDLAEVFPELTLTERRKVYRILDIGMLSDIFEHIDETVCLYKLGKRKLLCYRVHRVGIGEAVHEAVSFYTAVCTF